MDPGVKRERVRTAIADINAQNAAKEEQSLLIETKMTPGAIIELKKALQSNSILRDEVCTMLAIKVLTISDEEREQDDELRGQTTQDYAHEVAMLALDYRDALEEVFELPSGRWPDNLALPDEFSEILEKLRDYYEAGDDNG
jgi:hypothetical protein